MPIMSPGAPAALRAPSVNSQGLGPSPPRDIIDHPLGMAEVDDSRKDVSGNRHDRDNDINDKHRNAFCLTMMTPGSDAFRHSGKIFRLNASQRRQVTPRSARVPIW